MNQKLKLALLLMLCVLLSGCAKKAEKVPAIDISDAISANISTITLHGYGKTTQITSSEEIAEIKSVIEGIAFEPATPDASIDAPGAISVTVTLEYQDGSQQKITYPYYLHNDNTYVSDEAAIAAFDKYFD